MRFSVNCPTREATPCEVTDENQLDSVIEAVHRDLGAPKVLIHNAVGGAFGNFTEIEPQVLNRNFQVNTMALLYLVRRLAPAMIEAGQGPQLVAVLRPQAIVASGNTPALRRNRAAHAPVRAAQRAQGAPDGRRAALGEQSP